MLFHKARTDSGNNHLSQHRHRNHVTQRRRQHHHTPSQQNSHVLHSYCACTLEEKRTLGSFCLGVGSVFSLVELGYVWMGQVRSGWVRFGQFGLSKTVWSGMNDGDTQGLKHDMFGTRPEAPFILHRPPEVLHQTSVSRCESSILSA